jgi:hypothetical protein
MAIHNFCTQCGDVDAIHNNECRTCKEYEADTNARLHERLELIREIGEHQKKLMELHDIILAKEAKVRYLSTVLEG